MAFRYQAVDSAGQTVADSVHASSPREAADRLRERGLFVTQMDEVADGGRVSADSRGSGKTAESVLFTAIWRRSEEQEHRFPAEKLRVVRVLFSLLISLFVSLSS